MKLNPFIYYFVFFIILSNSIQAQIYNTQVDAKIKISSTGDYYNITGSSYNKTEISKSLRYVLSVIKTNPNNDNKSKNDQQGRFILEPNQSKELSTTTVNVESKDRTIILLLVYNEEDKILGKDRIVLNDIEDKNTSNINSKKEIVNISEDAKHDGADGVMIRGIVVENTKTKPGRDFYSKFSTKYRNSGINGIKVITVNEILAVGSNTKVQLVIGDDIIVQFFVNPRSDYIDQMVDYSINKTNSYFNNLRKNWNVLKKY